MDIKIVKMSKDIMLIIDAWNFDFNQKKIQTALFQHIEHTVQVEYERMQQFNTSMKRIEVQTMDVWNEFPFSFSYKENVTIIDYLKMIGLKIESEESQGIIAHILSIIDIVEYLESKTSIIILLSSSIFFLAGIFAAIISNILCITVIAAIFPATAL